MKKQLKTTVLAAALLASVTGAFASDITNALSGKKLTEYRWVKYNRNGTVDTTTPTVVSPTNPFAEECSGLDETCAIGTDVDNPSVHIIVKYEALP